MANASNLVACARRGNVFGVRDWFLGHPYEDTTEYKRAIEKALSEATTDGHVEVVQVLLEEGRLSSDTLDSEYMFDVSNWELGRSEHSSLICVFSTEFVNL